MPVKFGPIEDVEAHYRRVEASPLYARFFAPDTTKRERRTRVRKMTLRQAIAQASKAGMAVSGATVAADGSVALMFGGSAKAPNKSNGHDIETAEELRSLI